MKQKIYLILLLLILLQSCTKDETSDNDLTYSIVLIVGQSNTHSGIGLNPEVDAPQEGITQLGRFGNDDMEIISAIEPLQHHTKSENKIGFGLTFAKLLKEYLNNETNILIIPCGYGGTSFQNNHWNQGDDLYNDAVIRVRTIITRNPGSKLISILWHQGESDVGNPFYKNDLDNFIINLRSDLDTNDVPFIVGGMVPFWVDQDNERVHQQEIILNTVNRHESLGYANPELPFRIEKADNLFDMVHYDAEGQRELGKRYFNEFIKLIE